MDFLRRYGFWVATGVVLLVAAVFFVVGVRRAAAENQRLRSEIKSEAEKVSQLASRKDLPDRRLVEAYEQYEANLQKEYEEELNLIKSRSVDYYNRRLPNVADADCVTRQTPDGQEYLVPRGAAFKTAYPQAVAGLIARLQSRGIIVGTPGVALPRLAGAIPEPDLILDLQSQYWLLSDIVDALVKTPVVDEVIFLGEELGAGREMRAAAGGRPEAGALMPASGGESLRGFESTSGGRGSEAMQTFTNLVSGSVGVTTEMNKLFSPGSVPPAQRQFRLVVRMDSRELPVLIASLMNMSRLTMVRAVEVYRSPTPYGEKPTKPEVRVDIRALCFDRYQEFVPAEVGAQP